MSRKPVPAQHGERSRVEVTFDRPQLLPQLFREYDSNILALEERLGIYIHYIHAREVLQELHSRLIRGEAIDTGLIDAFVILNEAQNTTPMQMKMFLTRFGQNSRMVVCGDPKQTDLPGGPSASGLNDGVAKLEGIEGIAMVSFGIGDVVHHPIVGRIVEAYEANDA